VKRLRKTTRCSIPGGDWEVFSSPPRPASYPMGTRGLSLGVKRPGREFDHSSPSSAEVKNARHCTSTLQYIFMAWCLGKHRIGVNLEVYLLDTGLIRYHFPHLLDRIMKNISFQGDIWKWKCK
jgi:hypothetical protein